MISLKEFINDISSSNMNRELVLIKKAFNFANEKHEGQIRKYNTKDPYFLHLVRVGRLLKDFDDEVIIAGLLHDVLEDTKTTTRELEDIFGSEVALLVLGCTKNPDKGNPVEILRRTAESDYRVILIKLADRNDNLQDDITRMKVRTIRNYVNQTPLILELAREYEIIFLVEEIHSKIEELKKWLISREQLGRV
ncbi:MAG: HD domain-containing protein [Candidatus Hodarchaeales archaeon]|jgi:GTP pyrophosphokinase